MFKRGDKVVPISKSIVINGLDIGFVLQKMHETGFDYLTISRIGKADRPNAIQTSGIPEWNFWFLPEDLIHYKPVSDHERLFIRR